MALDPEIFECFASPMYKDGKKQLIGVPESKLIKRAAVLRGFTTKRGAVRKRLSALEALVIAMRDATSADDFNHEWWAAEASKPQWVRKLDTVFRGGWLYFPAHQKDLTAHNIGDRIGFQLAISERRLGQTLREHAYRQRVERAELEKAQRGLEEEDKRKVRVVIPGYDDLKELAKEQYERVASIRQHVLAIAGALRERESGDFIAGLAAGTLRAHEASIDDALSEFNEREEVAEILAEGWWSVSQMKTRSEITDYVISHLPPAKRTFLEKSRRQPPDRQEQYKRFVERLRQTFYEKLGLKPATRGRPVKSVRG